MLAVGAIKTPAAEVRCLNSPFEECVVVGISSRSLVVQETRQIKISENLIAIPKGEIKAGHQEIRRVQAADMTGRRSLQWTGLADASWVDNSKP